MQSPGSKRRAKKEVIKNFFSKENVEKRKMEKLRKLQSEGAEFLSEAKVREIIKSNKVKGFKKMQNANKHIYATKKTINELAKINEYLGMELKLDDSRTRGDRSKKDFLPVMVDDAIALRDKLELAIGKVKQEIEEIEHNTMKMSNQWLEHLTRYNSEAIYAENDINLGKRINVLRSQIDVLRSKVDKRRHENIETLKKVAEHRKQRVSAMIAYQAQAKDVQKSQAAKLIEKKGNKLKEEIKAKRLRRYIKNFKKRVTKRVKKFERIRDQLKLEIEKETAMTKKMRHMSLSPSTDMPGSKGSASRSKMMEKQRSTMRKQSLLIAMRRASKKVKTQKMYEMGAKDLFIKILEVKKRIHRKKNNNDSGNLDSEGSEAEPTRADLEAIVNDFVVKGQQTDSLMLQNNRLAKEVEERTRMVMELEERVAGNAQIKKKKENIQSKKDHLENLNKAIDKYKTFYAQTNQVFKAIKPQVHGLFQLLKCGDTLTVGDKLHNVYFKKDKRASEALLSQIREIEEVKFAGKQIERKTEEEENSTEAAVPPAFEDNNEESHERDSVFYYHNPMLALGLIEMQLQNVLRSHTLETEVIEEPQLDKKPEDPNSPLKRVKLPKSKDYDQLRDGTKDDEPPLYFLELQSETKYRNGLGLETFHAKERAANYRKRGRRRGIFGRR